MRSDKTQSSGRRRADLGDRYFRSTWEANYARYLNWLVSLGKVTSWEYEAKTFEFEGIKRGTRFYTPDFKVVLPSGKIEWHEVKGWMDAGSQTRLNRMAKYYPNEVIKVFDATWFKAANRNVAPMIPTWERGSAR